MPSMPACRAALALSAVVFAPIACGPADDASEPLAVASFDVVERGWGDAPLPVHFAWSVSGAPGAKLTCHLDRDGDGTFDQTFDPCDADTTRAAVASLPSHTFAAVGEHRPRLSVTDGRRTVEATTKVFANELVFLTHTVRPETLPGFVKADVTPMTKVVLTYADATKLPKVAVGDVLWGTSGSGYALKVAAVTKAGATLTATGTVAGFADAIHHGFFGARDVVAPMTGARCLEPACVGIKLVPPTESGGPGVGAKALGRRADALGIDVRDEHTVTLGVPLPGGEGWSHTMKVGVTVKEFVVHVGWDVWHPVVDRVSVDVRPFLKYAVTASKAFEKSFDLGKISLGAIPLGPVVITPIVVPSARLAFTLKATATVGVGLPLRFGYEDGRWSADIEPKTEPALELADETGASVGAEASVSFVPKINAAIMGVAGPYVAPTFTLAAGLDLRTPKASDAAKCGAGNELHLTASARLGGEIGLACPLFDADGPSKSFDLAEWTFLDKKLASLGGSGGCAAAAPAPASDAGAPAKDGGADAASTCPTSGPPGKPECAKCEHAVCTVGTALSPSCGTCAQKVCAADDYCCTQQWTLSCLQKANALCGAGCKL